MGRSTPKRMKEKTPQIKRSKGKFKKFVILIIIVLIGLLIYKYINTDEWKIGTVADENEKIPVIYYSEDDGPQRILSEEDNIFSSNIEIASEEECSISVKKDGKDFSNKNITILTEEGTYEITAKSKSGKKSLTRTLQIDKTPPNVDITRNPSGSYTITFADVNDIGTAKLIKLNPSTGKTLKETDLMENQLQKSIEINEKGTYSLEVTDKLGNLFVGTTEFDIE